MDIFDLALDELGAVYDEGYYAPPPPPPPPAPAAAVSNKYSGGSCSSESSVTTVSAGSSEDQPIQVGYSEEEWKTQMNDMRDSYTSSNVIMQYPQQVGGNQVPDDFFDFSGSANVMQQVQEDIGFLDIETSDEIFSTETGSTITNNSVSQQARLGDEPH
ncbi:hypothetical protein PIB30_087683 [Stylosanthes scabra]|uniref:Uncharacterized protein n=1 Tax=Stylosanthes scabra TaxID=79078 RepID=A0ABU6RTE2_9FABA|nr:hypothetical protein [Stylosanthes scabra]